MLRGSLKCANKITDAELPSLLRKIPRRCGDAEMGVQVSQCSRFVSSQKLVVSQFEISLIHGNGARAGKAGPARPSQEIGERRLSATVPDASARALNHRVDQLRTFDVTCQPASESLGPDCYLPRRALVQYPVCQTRSSLTIRPTRGLLKAVAQMAFSLSCFRKTCRRGESSSDWSSDGDCARPSAFAE